MQIYSRRAKNFSMQTLFDQYPWAGNHKDAIACITRYMDDDAESIIQQLDERILRKLAKCHL